MLDGWHYVASKVFNVDGVYQDAWLDHTIGEIPRAFPGGRVCNYQAKRTWTRMTGFSSSTHPTWSGYSAFKDSCSWAAYFDLPDRDMREGYKLKAYWKSNLTGGSYIGIGTHEFGIN